MELMEENIKVAITVSKYDYRRLKLWAATHGKTPSAFAGQIVAARLESNFDAINKQIADYAKSRGIAVEELEIELIDDND